MWQPSENIPMEENIQLSNNITEDVSSIPKDITTLLDISLTDVNYDNSPQDDISSQYQINSSQFCSSYNNNPNYLLTIPESSGNISSSKLNNYLENSYSNSSCCSSSVSEEVYNYTTENELNINYNQINNKEGISNEMENFKKTSVTNWRGEDCLDWAASICKERNIPLTQTNIAGLSSLNGGQLLILKDKQFAKNCDNIIGPILYKNMKRKRRELRKSAESALNESTTTKGVQIPNITYSSEEGVETPYSSDSRNYQNMSDEIGSIFSSYEGNSTIIGRECNDRFSDVIMEDSQYHLTDCLQDDNQTHKNDDYRYSFENSFQLNSNDSGLTELLKEDEARSLSPGEILSNAGTPSDLSPYHPPSEINDDSKEASMDYLVVPQTQSQTKTRRRRASRAKQVSKVGSQSPCGSLKSSNDFFKKIPTGPRNMSLRSPKSWEYLVRLLMNPISNPDLIKWDNETEGVFRLMKKDDIARIWGARETKDKKPKQGSYDSFARILRHHYTTGFLQPVSEKHLVYRLSEDVNANIKKGEIP